ncbi:MAG: hypothetical protein HY665_01255 [Chloroflexi bacterium]|nr:hypothetical protein [Chloroflexota bacterium]
MTMNKETILANCINEIQSGRSTIEECLARYPELRDELRPLLELAASIRPAKLAASTEFKERAKARLFDAMRETRVKPRKQAAGSWVYRLLTARAMTPVLTSLLAVLITVSLAGGTVYAAQSSLPGDALYPVKTGAEKFQLVITFDPEDKAELHLKLSERRLDEIVVQVGLNRDISAANLASVAKETDSAIREISKVSPDDARNLASRLAETTLHQQVTLGSLMPAVSQQVQPSLEETQRLLRRGNTIAQVVYSNPSFLSHRPSISDESLDAGTFKLDGILLGVEGRTWNISGLIIKNVNYPQPVPPVGSRVKLEGLYKNKQSDELFVTKLESEEKTSDEVKISGFFKGASQDGKTWNIGGVPFSVSDNGTSPVAGDEVEIRGTVENGTLVTRELQKKEEEDDKGKGKKGEAEVEFDGVLTKVDTESKTITVKVAGALFTVDVSEARIRSSDGESIAFSELKSLVGKGVEIKDVSKKEGLFSAKNVRVDIEKKERSDRGERSDRDRREPGEKKND